LIGVEIGRLLGD